MDSNDTIAYAQIALKNLIAKGIVIIEGDKEDAFDSLATEIHLAMDTLTPEEARIKN